MYNFIYRMVLLKKIGLFGKLLQTLNNFWMFLTFGKQLDLLLVFD